VAAIHGVAAEGSTTAQLLLISCTKDLKLTARQAPKVPLPFQTMKRKHALDNPEDRKLLDSRVTAFGFQAVPPGDTVHGAARGWAQEHGWIEELAKQRGVDKGHIIRVSILCWFAISKQHSQWL
jgi:hypothetical protein